MPRVSLETKRTMDTTHAGLAGVLLVLIFVAFGYWCYYVNEIRNMDDTDILRGKAGNPGAEEEKFVRSEINQTTVFQAAVVGFLLIITVKHLRDLVYHM